MMGQMPQQQSTEQSSQGMPMGILGQFPPGIQMPQQIQGASQPQGFPMMINQEQLKQMMMKGMIPGGMPGMQGMQGMQGMSGMQGMQGMQGMTSSQGAPKPDNNEQGKK